MYIGLCSIDWDAITCVVTTAMTIFAGATLWVNYKWRRDDLKARLTFEVISWNHLFLLKVTNVGKETAYNVKLEVTGGPIMNHFSDDIKNEFSALKNMKLSLVSGRTIYFYLSPVYSTNNASYKIGRDEFSSQEINKWLDKYMDMDICIDGMYCKRYKIKEKFSMRSFIGCKSIIVETPTEIALQEISNGIACKNNLHKPIQQRIEDIYKVLCKNE